MRLITLEPPALGPRSVTFRWRVEPATPLYQRTEFALTFPPALDLAAVPPGLWWTIALLCLHSHWTLLRPCRVLLPVTLRPGEVEFWSRLLDAEVATLEAHGGTAQTARTIEIVDRGPALAPLPPIADSGRCAAAFSGGKDSLLQAGLLAELTRRPILVTTTSPLPPLHDHQTARRRHVLGETAARLDVLLVEVLSDFRSCWQNDFPPRVGYPVAVNEITDSFLYFAALLAVGASLGAPHLFLASETEVQENVELDGRIVQHPHFMYAAATQRALETLLRPLRARYGSLISALHSAQVQELLWTRYPGLCDLQYSCWRVGEGEATCSRCSQCLRIAMSALVLADTPERMGIDLVRLLAAMRDWAPRRPLAIPATQAAGRDLPAETVSRILSAQTVRSIAATPPRRVLAALARGGAGRLLRRSGWRALRDYSRMRRRLAGEAPGPAPGYRAAFVAGMDDLLRDRVGAIYAARFPAANPAAYAGVLARSEALARWIGEPLGGQVEGQAAGACRRSAAP